MNIMMACGHTANAHNADGNPCCVICSPTVESQTIIGPPNLEGRLAKCSYSHSNQNIPEHVTGVPSSLNLAFFEFKGEGSNFAVQKCRCGYYDVAHRGPKMGKWVKNPPDHDFEARGANEFDEYYCGCRGWD